MDTVKQPTPEKAFCKKLCVSTNAFVYGSDTLQTYSYAKNTQDFASDPEMGQVDYGDWEGQLYEFIPPGGTHRAIKRAGNDYF